MFGLRIVAAFLIASDTSACFDRKVGGLSKQLVNRGSDGPLRRDLEDGGSWPQLSTRVHRAMAELIRAGKAEERLWRFGSRRKEFKSTAGVGNSRDQSRPPPPLAG